VDHHDNRLALHPDLPRVFDDSSARPESIAAEFDIKEEFISQLTLSIFILAYAVGPLFLGPLSETYGRAIVWQLAIFSILSSILPVVSRSPQGN